MSTATPLNSILELPPAAPLPKARVTVAPAALPKHRAYREWLFMAALAVLVGAAWRVSQQDFFTPGDPVGYWLGVVGGSMMLLLLLYPLRKHIRAFQRWGNVKMWLWVHMLLGIGGPLLILIHCKFQAGSMNAAAALYSMVIVASSGVMGRFLYVRVNRGLAVERQTLDSMRRALVDGGDKSVLSVLAPVRERLQAFDAMAVGASERAGAPWFVLALVLPWQSWVSRLKTQAFARSCLKAMAVQKGWSADALKRRQQRLRKEIVGYYIGVMRVALFSAWAKLFSWWHVAHVPFVFLLVIAGVVHVVAVHAY